MELGYKEFKKENKRIIGEYTYVLRDEKIDIFNSRETVDYIFSAEDKQVQRFFEYKLDTKEGYYDYPISIERSIRITLKNLEELKKIKNLNRYIKYNKRFIDFHTFFEVIHSRSFIIDGNLFEPILLSGENTIIGEHFIINVIKNINLFRNSTLEKTLIELHLLNSSRIGASEISSSTSHFLFNIINNIIDKKQSKEKYAFIISEMEKMINQKVSEKDWQTFIYENYRYLFPEYLTIIKEFELDTIDSDKKYIDFLLTNQNTDLLLEIKLPHAQVLSNAKDRNNYYFVANVNKSILQAYRYFNSYKEFLFRTGRDKNTKVILLIGLNLESENDADKANNDFELARSLYSKIDILTYSELINKLRNIKSLL